ncbi:MAG: crotonobetainyl-CoA:carnitine CoA-transferase CaiB-like acyl-CoA transferase [Candidatus Poriferisodalaceae bacterium]|jgi:crotonobetainyl-CoA:carnitine CoA-transferase CaiB-like acyl-CoA transferase
MLDGVRVLDLTQYLSGPSCTLLLAGLGADVIKIEPGPVGDMSRLLPIVKDGHSSYYIQQNRGKRSVCVNLDDPEGHEIVRQLAMKCDVLVENFSLGVLEKRGLGQERLRAQNPGLIYVSISAYGRTGSKAHLPGYDLIGQAVAGSVALTGDPDGPPIAAGAPIADMSAGMMAFGAIGHALFSRTSTGVGQFIDVSMVESVFQMHPFAVQGPSVTEGKARLRRSGRHFGSVPPAGTYRGPDGWLVLQVLDAQWKRLCEAAEAIALSADERFSTPRGRADHRHELVDVLEAWMQTFDSNDQLLAHFEAHRVPAAPVIDPADAHDDPWFRERGAVTEVIDPYLGPVTVPGFPLHMSAVPDREVEPLSPTLGQHNAEVLTEVLGYDTARIQTLTASGVLLQQSLDA